MQLILSLVWQWFKDAQFHKMAASTAAGTSIGFITVMGVLETRIDKVNADVTHSQVEIIELQNFVKNRKELTDERFQRIDHDLKYLKGAIDATNQNILDVSTFLKKGR